MIRVFNCSSIWPGKVNFVDSNNVLVGYNLSASCCEHAHWTITEHEDGSGLGCYSGDEGAVAEFNIDSYSFDPTFFKIVDSSYDCQAVVFRLQHDCFHYPRGLPEGEPVELFLRLENNHNGYYSHGFTFLSRDRFEEGYI